MVNDSKILGIIISGNDWKDILSSIIIEENMDPKNLDIKVLADTFMQYLNKMENFDFRVPGRFILISSILLRMKCEKLLEEDHNQKKTESVEEDIRLEDSPLLTPPIIRKTTKKVTLPDLVSALNKAFEFREKKEQKKVFLRQKVEDLIEPEKNIEDRISEVFETIKSKGDMMIISDIILNWNKDNIVKFFVPMLHLMLRKKIILYQDEDFGKITIKVRSDDHESDD